MRVLWLLLVAGCTINGRGPDPVTARPPADPDRMPTAVLDHQDPAADTSKHPVLSRTATDWRDPEYRFGWLGGKLRPAGCMCDAGSGTGSDLGGLLVVVAAALVATGRRRPRTTS